MANDSYTVELFRYTEQVVEGKRLGRHRLVDSRSAAYPYQAATVPVVTTGHPRHIPILDQGNLGSCTGNAMVGAAGTSPVFEALPAGYPVLDEAEAVKLYSAATRLDAFAGAFPPTDTGSDGTSVDKAAQAAGLISGYTHANGIDQILQALMAGPALFGIDWYDSFDTPATDGLVAITANAYVRGGHEVVGRRVDADRKWIGFDNSWSADWGSAGSFWMSWDDVASLMANGGDCVVPVPLSKPQPQPQPVPTPVDNVPADMAFAGTLMTQNELGQRWTVQRHGGYNAKVARDGETWLRARKFVV